MPEFANGGQSMTEDKPVAIQRASPGLFGGLGAQLHLCRLRALLTARATPTTVRPSWSAAA